jgi:hypothetical protein
MKKVILIFLVLFPIVCFSVNDPIQTKKDAFQRYVKNTLPLTFMGIKGAVGTVCLGLGLHSWKELLAAHRIKIPTSGTDYVASGFLIASGMYNVVQAIKDYRNL